MTKATQVFKEVSQSKDPSTMSDKEEDVNKEEPLENYSKKSKLLEIWI